MSPRRPASAIRLGPGRCIGDYDNDGYDDLFVTYFGKNVLYHNNGDGTFTDVSEKAGVAGTASAGTPAARSSTTIATAVSICSSPTTSISISQPLRSPNPARASTKA